MNKAKKYKIIDYIFWINLIIFTNPGAIIVALGEDPESGGINVTDFLFVILFLCFITVFKNTTNYKDIIYIKTKKYLFLFLLYYLIVFSFFVPLFKDNPLYSPITTFIKVRHGIINIFLVLMVYLFYLRSSLLFIKYLLWSSLIVIVLFLITITVRIDILPVHIMERGFIKADRLMMVNYGLMSILIPMGVVMLVYRFKIKYRQIIFICALLMYLLWILGLFRRHIFGSIILFIMAAVVYNYMHRKSLIPIKKILNSMVYLSIMLGIIYLSFPKYVEAGIEAGNQTIHVIQYGETTTGQKDARMGMGKKFMQDLIKENWMFGTGFDNRWRTGEGDDSGFEASDYPFLGAIAMTGVIGLLVFLPIYFVLIKTIIYDIKYLRKNQINVHSIETFIFITFIIYFVYDFMQYMNWFLPMALFSTTRGYEWYIFLALYLASRNLFYQKERLNKYKPTINPLMNNS